MNKKGINFNFNIHVRPWSYREYRITNLKDFRHPKISDTHILKLCSIENELHIFFQGTRDLRILRDTIDAYLETGIEQSVSLNADVNKEVAATREE